MSGFAIFNIEVKKPEEYKEYVEKVKPIAEKFGGEYIVRGGETKVLEGTCDINQDKARVVYENDEVGVHHSLVTFNDGNVEAVMAVYRYKDGKIVSLETGATPMSK